MERPPRTTPVTPSQTTGPQAYFLLGSFMHGTQRFDEAVVAFESSRPLVSAFGSRQSS